jgi:hypothetical protein
MTSVRRLFISNIGNVSRNLAALAIFFTHFVSAEAQTPVAESSPPKIANTESAEDKISFKLTPSWYRSDDGTRAGDINLRANTETQTAWLGYYRDKTSFSQTRVGYENKIDSGWLRTVLSAQVASGGFVGGSITAEIGGETYGIVGFGRTNLRDYYNLNFDPNDAITLGAGTRALEDTELTLFYLWDDRLHTQQRVTHAIIRKKFANKQRLTLDISLKSGLTTEDNFVRGYAATLTYDFKQYFLRVARDEYVNFSPTAQYRVSLGARF